jgi:hypothetical protein
LVVGLTSQKIYGDLAEHRNGLCSLLLADPAGILLKRDIKDPVQGVLDAPVLPHGFGKPHGLGWQGRQKIPRSDLDGIPYFATRFHHPHALPIGPSPVPLKKSRTRIKSSETVVIFSLAVPPKPCTQSAS